MLDYSLYERRPLHSGPQGTTDVEITVIPLFRRLSQFDPIFKIKDTQASLKRATRRMDGMDYHWLCTEARQAAVRLEHRFHHTKSSEDKQVFVAVPKSARKAIQMLRSDYIKEQFHKVAGNNATTWRFANGIYRPPML